MSRYKPDHLGHQVMTALATGASTMAQVCERLPRDWSHEKRRRKALHVLEALERDALAWRADDAHGLTAYGRACLEDLDHRQPVVTHDGRPNVRVFIRAAAHPL